VGEPLFIPTSVSGNNGFDLAMRVSLANSLEYLCAAAEAQLNCTKAEVSALLTEVQAHRLKPGVFGRYFQLVMALRGEQFWYASKLLREIRLASRHVPAFRIVPLSEEAIGEDKTLYEMLIDPSPSGLPLLVPPTDAQWDNFDGKLLNALNIIQRADAALAAEIRSLLVEVIGAAPSKGDNSRRLGSASSFMLWGAALVNVEYGRNSYDLIGAVVHEAAHQLLFAHSIDEPLVLNASDECYASPLRADLRPMDGVYHATFVSARMHYALTKLCDICIIDIAEIDSRLATLKQLYNSGLETIRKFGRLSDVGADILDETSEYMRAA
jgi:hypothetical protein